MSHPALLAAHRFYAPLMALFAFVVLLTRDPQTGVGFVAGLMFAAMIALHMIVFGAASAQRALPPPAARVIVALGLVLALGGAGAPRLLYAPQLLEAGLFAITAAGFSLVLNVVAARAPTFRDGGD